MKKHTWKRIWSIVTTVLVVVMVLSAVFLMGSRLMGYEMYTVLSGSMEPTFHVGDLLLVDKNVDVASIQEGTPITFILNENYVIATHRVVRVDAENQHFYTKGDANEIEDNDPVHFKNVIGVPKLSIPKLGYVSNYIQNPPGTYVAIAVCAVLVILVFLPSGGSKKKKEETPEKKEESPASP